MPKQIMQYEVKKSHCSDGCHTVSERCAYFDDRTQTYQMCPSLIWLQYAGRDYKPEPIRLSEPVTDQ